MRKFIVFLYLAFVGFFLPAPFPSFAFMVEDSLHGFRVDLPGSYVVSASSKLGKVIIRHRSGVGGLSVFVLKRARSRDPLYSLRIVALPAREALYKRHKKGALALLEGTYLDFVPYFDTEYAQAISSQGVAGRPAKALVLLERGKKHDLVILALPPPGAPMKELSQILRKFKLFKPKVRYRNLPIQSNLFGFPAAFVDLPKGWRIEGGFLPTRLMEVPELRLLGERGGASFHLIGYQYTFMADPMMPMGMAQAIDPCSGQFIPIAQSFSSPEEMILFYLEAFGVQGEPEIRPIASEPLPLNPAITLVTYRLTSRGPVKLFGFCPLQEAFQPLPDGSQIASWNGFLYLAWGEGEEFAKAFGTLSSLLINPQWAAANFKAALGEARAEMAHRQWMWQEFKKTHDYIKRLHREEMTAEQVFQEEMARGLCNILSDYTYVRDPETGEVFHIQDEAQEYWRHEEGEILGIAEGEIEPAELESMGWHRLQVRLEGFGKW